MRAVYHSLFLEFLEIHQDASQHDTNRQHRLAMAGDRPCEDM